MKKVLRTMISAGLCILGVYCIGSAVYEKGKKDGIELGRVQGASDLTKSLSQAFSENAENNETNEES